MVDLQTLTAHPEQMNKETLYALRSLLARYPYYQPARLLLLQNLYLLHDSSFGDELRSAAICIADRRKIFQMVEAAHYQLDKPEQEKTEENKGGDRTSTLIDSFLEQMPEEEKPVSKPAKSHRQPTAADAHDYVAFLMQEDMDYEPQEAPEMKGQSLIDDFISQDGGKIELKDEPEYVPEAQGGEEGQDDGNEGIFTETLARIYIQQGRYEKALKIIKRLNLLYPKKNGYFADQIRFLEKLILNDKNKIN